jgi:hypothetical protein
VLAFKIQWGEFPARQPPTSFRRLDSPNDKQATLNHHVLRHSYLLKTYSRVGVRQHRTGSRTVPETRRLRLR